jgi:hypothetical protein
VLLDQGQQVTHGVHHREQHVGGARRHRHLAVAQPGEEVLADVGDRLQLAEGKEAARALDRVDRAEDAAQQLSRAGLALERDQVAVELVQVLVALHEELLDDLVDLIHRGCLPSFVPFDEAYRPPAEGPERRISAAGPVVWSGALRRGVG